MECSDPTKHETYGDFRDAQRWDRYSNDLEQWQGELQHARDRHRSAGTDWRDEPELWDLSHKIQGLKTAMEAASKVFAAEQDAEQQAQAVQSSAPVRDFNANLADLYRGNQERAQRSGIHFRIWPPARWRTPRRVLYRSPGPSIRRTRCRQEAPRSLPLNCVTPPTGKHPGVMATATGLRPEERGLPSRWEAQAGPSSS